MGRSFCDLPLDWCPWLYIVLDAFDVHSIELELLGGRISETSRHAACIEGCRTLELVASGRLESTTGTPGRPTVPMPDLVE